MLVVLSHKRDSGGTKEQWQGLSFSEYCFKTTMSQIFVSLTRPHCCNFSSPDSTRYCTNPDALLEWWVLQPLPESSRCHAPSLRAPYYKSSVGWLWLCHVLQTSSAGCSFGIGLYLFPACSTAWMSGPFLCMSFVLSWFSSFPVYNYHRVDDESCTHVHIQL